MSRLQRLAFLFLCCVCLLAPSVALARAPADSAQLPAEPQRLPPFVDLDAYHSTAVDLDFGDAVVARTGQETPFLPELSANLVLPASHHGAPYDSHPEPWSFQILPDGLIFDNYLAGLKESRFGTQIQQLSGDGWMFDPTLGARVGLIRFGSHDRYRPEGWQIDAEGSAHLRLDIPEEVDVRSADFRAGLPITYGRGRHRVKLAYYHLSSHVGDEFLIKNPGFMRLNYSRDAFVLAYAAYLTDWLRAYAEADWAFYSDVSEPWHFQFGMDFAPPGPTGLRGAPFAAVNSYLRQEVNYNASLTVQAGWAWRGDHNSHMLRAGLHYYNGPSNQFSFFGDQEDQIGFGLWYDF